MSDNSCYDFVRMLNFLPQREREMDAHNYNHEGDFYTTVDGVPVRKLFVGNLPTDVDSLTLHGQLNDKLQCFGQLREINVIQRPEAKPFAFVMFCTPQDAAKVLKITAGIFLARRRLYISPADSWHQPHEMPDGTIIWDRRLLATLQPKAESNSEAEEGDNEEEDEEEAEPAGQQEADTSNNEDCKPNEEKDDAKVEAKAKEKQDCLINKLNDDCLRLIFDKMSIPDRMTLGSVCRRWRALNAYFWRSFKKLDFTSPPFQYVNLTDNKLKYFLHHCVNANCLNIAQDVNQLTSKSIISIAKSCKNLEELHLRCIGLQRRSLAFLANCCPTLKSFSVDDCNHVFDGEMMSLVKKARNLESISLKYGRKTKGHWLAHLQGPIHSLMLEMYEFDPTCLVQGISRISSTLRHLNLVSCPRLRGRDLEAIVKLCPDLTKFGLSGMCSVGDLRNINLITKLSKLEHLDLEHNRYINDGFMENLVSGCTNLKQLNISGMDSSHVTEKGLAHLAKLSNLQSLSMAGIVAVSDSLLKSISKKLTKLEHLDVTSCQQITDEGCIEILNNCSRLKSFDVARCILVTNETITAAMNVLSDDPARTLTIVCGCTKIFDEPKFAEHDTNKRLKLDLKATVYSGYLNGFTLDDNILLDVDTDEEDDDDFSYDDDDFSDPDVFDIFDMIHDHYEFNLGYGYDGFFNGEDDGDYLHIDDF
ncbi:LRR [Nesidiocoris tenuis]|uniref:LRR n=1 Tax=Nesidiocoris tenuis TaxID=355587 RepID=A0ABN7A7U8_9HEMI|nr:LRR [Nesidiocoris tenuis]